MILTADDPNREDPAAIAEQIRAHMTRPSNFILDREEAIQTAMNQTNSPKDAVIIAGKGLTPTRLSMAKRPMTVIWK